VFICGTHRDPQLRCKVVPGTAGLQPGITGFTAGTGFGMANGVRARPDGLRKSAGPRQSKRRDAATTSSGWREPVFIRDTRRDPQRSDADADPGGSGAGLVNNVAERLSRVSGIACSCHETETTETPGRGGAKKDKEGEQRRGRPMALCAIAPLRCGFSKIGNRLVFRHSPARARQDFLSWLTDCGRCSLRLKTHASHRVRRDHGEERFEHQ
jgi:hypothetical protein